MNTNVHCLLNGWIQKILQSDSTNWSTSVSCEVPRPPSPPLVQNSWLKKGGSAARFPRILRVGKWECQGTDVVPGVPRNWWGEWCEERVVSLWFQDCQGGGTGRSERRLLSLVSPIEGSEVVAVGYWKAMVVKMRFFWAKICPKKRENFPFFFQLSEILPFFILSFFPVIFEITRLFCRFP